MRTTLTLDDDVSALLSQLMKERKTGLKETVNEALRAGLPKLMHLEEPRIPYETQAVDLGKARRPNIDRLGEKLAILEN